MGADIYVDAFSATNLNINLRPGIRRLNDRSLNFDFSLRPGSAGFQ